MTTNMSQNNSNHTDQTSNLNYVNTCDETDLENLAKFVDDTLTDMKKCLDQVLDLRGKYNSHIIYYSTYLIQMLRQVLIQ